MEGATEDDLVDDDGDEDRHEYHVLARHQEITKGLFF